MALIGAIVFVALSLAPARGLYLLFGLLFFVPITINAGWPGETLTWMLLAATGNAAIGSARRIVAGEHRGGGSKGVSLTLLIMCVAAAVNWSDLGAMQVSLRPFVVFALLAWHVAAEARRSPELTARLLHFLLWCSVPVAALAIYQRLTGTWPVLDDYATGVQYRSFSGQDRSAGTMGHPIIYGAFTMAMIVAAWGRRPRGWTLFVAINAVGLILSGARSAWLATGIALVALFLLSRNKVTSKGIATFYAAAIATAFAYFLYPDAFRGIFGEAAARFTANDAIASASARSTRVDAALDQITASTSTTLFGRGAGGAAQFLTTRGFGDGLAQTFDNSYLMLWFDYGVFAVIAMGAALAYGIVKRGDLTGRMLLLAFALQISLFDFFNWPAAMAVALLGIALRQPAVGLDPSGGDELEPLDERVGYAVRRS